MAASTIKPAHRIAAEHPERVAIRDVKGSHSYGEVLAKAVKLCAIIQKSVGQSKSQERIGFLCPNDVSYVVAQWACWAAGHIGNKNILYLFIYYAHICDLYKFISFAQQLYR